MLFDPLNWHQNWLRRNVQLYSFISASNRLRDVNKKSLCHYYLHNSSRCWRFGPNVVSIYIFCFQFHLRWEKWLVACRLCEFRWWRRLIAVLVLMLHFRTSLLERCVQIGNLHSPQAICQAWKTTRNMQMWFHRSVKKLALSKPKQLASRNFCFWKHWYPHAFFMPTAVVCQASNTLVEFFYLNKTS